MGFAPQIRSVTMATERAGAGWVSLSAAVDWTNVGNAPHYHGWKAEARLVGPDGRTIAMLDQRPTLGGILPGQSSAWKFSARLSDAVAGGSRAWRFQIRVPNPMPGGKPLRFANRDTDRDAEGWLGCAF
jgi:hypothetical protein